MYIADPQMKSSNVYTSTLHPTRLALLTARPSSFRFNTRRKTKWGVQYAELKFTAFIFRNTEKAC
jgi:hypothetical protein